MLRFRRLLSPYLSFKRHAKLLGEMARTLTPHLLYPITNFLIRPTISIALCDGRLRRGSCYPATHCSVLSKICIRSTSCLGLKPLTQRQYVRYSEDSYSPDIPIGSRVWETLTLVIWQSLRQFLQFDFCASRTGGRLC